MIILNLWFSRYTKPEPPLKNLPKLFLPIYTQLHTLATRLVIAEVSRKHTRGNELSLNLTTVAFEQSTLTRSIIKTSFIHTSRLLTIFHFFIVKFYLLTYVVYALKYIIGTYSPSFYFNCRLRL